MSNPATDNDTFQYYFDKYWGEAASGLSSVLTEITDKYSAQDFNNAVKQQEIAEKLSAEFDYYSQRASELAKKADSSGLSPNKSKLAQQTLDNTSMIFKEYSEQVKAKGIEALDAVDTSMLNSVNRQLLSAGGKAAGPLADSLGVTIKLLNDDYYGAAGAFVGAVAGAALGVFLVSTTAWISIPAAIIFGTATSNSFESIFKFLDPLGLGDILRSSGNNPEFNGAENLTSPIILDLDGDGVETINESEGVYFDHDGNLLAEKTGWVGKNDGLLVFDKNADGQISSGAELFGNQTTLTNGEKAANGFEALKDLDSNGDGVLNQSDEAWSKLQVWKDVNSNGVVDSGELLSMADAGIAAINTEYATGKTKDAAGNEHRETGSFTRTDGSEGKATDVWFKIDPARTRYVGDVELSDEVKALPNAVGFGELPDLQVAMAADKTLQALVNQYVNTEDAGERQKLLEPIIYQWAGVSDVDPYSRDPTKVYGHVMDARQLETLEKLTGTPYVGTWCWGEKDPNPHGRAAPVLIEQFNRFASFVESQLLAQSHYKNAFDAITLKYDESSESFVPDWTGFEEHLTGLLGTSDDTIVELANIARKLGSYSPELSRAVEDSLNRLSVTSPVLAALLDSKNAVGTAGNDYLTTGYGNEVLYGKGGDDRLFGGSGDDSYFFDKGDGKDRIYDSAGSDKIVFREGVNRENLEFSRNLTTVWIKLKDSEGQYTGDEIQLDNYFDFDGTLKEGAIESVELADGSVLSQADILASLVSEATEDNDLIFGTGQTDNLSGKAGDDQMYGFNGDDVIAGDAGNDTLSGDAGNDKLIGGEGNDELNGGLGNDTYLFSAGHGQDVIHNYDNGNSRVDRIRFDETITAEAVDVIRENDDLILKTSETDSIRVERYFKNHATSEYVLQLIEFADGTAWSIDDVKAVVLKGSEQNDVIRGYDNSSDELTGLQGNDALYGYSGEDRLVGGVGNDQLQGGAGNDTYVIAKGDGQDIITENRSGSDTDRILLGGGILPEHTSVHRHGQHLLITTDGDSQSIRVNNYFNSDAATNYAVDTIEFADGTQWDIETIKGKVIVPTESNDEIWGYGSDDTLSGLAGDDVIRAQSGNDSVDAGAGKDTVYGGDGQDALVGASGADRLYGENGDDQLVGDEGVDQLYGGSGNDSLNGGRGDDRLEGGAGNDTYVIARGDGHDTITEYWRGSDTDRIQLGEGISPESVVARRQNTDLLLHIGDDQSVRVRNYFNSDATTNYAVDAIVFADGTRWDIETVKQKVLVPTQGDDIILGYDSSSDQLSGLGGDDQLFGGAGDDVLDGGAGTDHLDGGTGSDVYLYGAGDGNTTINNHDLSEGRHDVLRFKQGISPDALRATRFLDDLLLTFSESGDVITVSDYFSQDTAGGDALDIIEFASGEQWDIATVKTLVQQSTDGDDTLYGYETRDELTGGLGNDRIYGKGGNDQLTGEDGDDHLYGGTGDDHLSGSSGQDYLDGESGDDHLEGGEGDDSLYGRAGNDYLDGGNNDDHLYGDYGNDQLVGGEGNDYLDGGRDDDQLTGGTGNDRLYGGYGNDSLTGGMGDDILSGDQGADDYYFAQGDGKDEIRDNYQDQTRLLLAGLDLDLITFRRVDDDLTLTFRDSTEDKVTLKYFFDNDLPKSGLTLVGPENVTQVLDKAAINLKTLEGTGLDDVIEGNDLVNQVTALDGNDRVLGYGADDVISGGDGQDRLQGGFGNDVLSGDSGDDSLEGEADDDHLTGGLGNDTLTGGEGADTYHFAAGDGQDVIHNYDSEGMDTIRFAESVSPGSVAVSRVGDDLLLSYGWNDQVTVSRFFQDEGHSRYALDTVAFADGTVWNKELLLDKALLGDLGDNLLRGYTTDDVLSGDAGNDILVGNAGDDSLRGGTGNDRLEGGVGDDTYHFAAGDGSDVIEDSAGIDTLIFEDLNDDDVLLRRQGDDLLITRHADSNDSVRILNHFTDQTGAVSLRAINVITFANGTRWNTDDILVQSVKGTEANDQILAHAENDMITALSGDDVVHGQGGHDQIDGGDGADTLYGETGRDVLLGGQGDDRLEGGDDDDRLEGGEGVDTLLGEDGSDQLFGGDQNDDLSGGGGNDQLFGDSGNDTLNGDWGDDTLHGGSGDDELTDLTGNNTLYGGEGNDKLSGRGHLFGNEGDDTLKGSGLLAGGEGHDVITGQSGSTLKGDAGNDTLIVDSQPWERGVLSTLEGGAGDDTLYGGFTDDEYLFNLGDGADRMIERRLGEAYSNYDASFDVLRFGEGIAAIDLSYARRGDHMVISHSNGSDQITIENWFREPTEHFKINSFEFADGTILSDADLEEQVVTYGTDGSDQTMIGYRDHHDEIHAGAGDDKVWGRAGNDVIHGDAGDDYLDGESGDDRLFGGEGNDNLQGKEGTDHLEGGMGSDSLSGGSGDDTLLGQSGADQLFGGEGNDHMEGGADDDYMDAGAGDDRLIGGDGNDQLRGEGGNDTLIGGAGRDTYVWAVGDGADVIDNRGGQGLLLLQGGATPESLDFSRDGDDLLIAMKDQTGQSIRIKNHFLGGDWALDGVQPDGGFMITTNKINQLVAGGSDPDFASVVKGTNDGERLVGSANNDKVLGEGGDDTLFGMSGNDRLEGSDGNDRLMGGNGSGQGSGDDVLAGGAGNDVLNGEDGNDTLNGGVGDDHYYYQAGDGVDTIDATGGGTDWVLFNGSISRDRISFHKDGNDLVMLLDNDLKQQLRVKDHFLGGEKAISYVQPSDGGYAIPASSFASLLTALPGGGDGSGGETGNGNGGESVDNSGGSSGGGNQGGETGEPTEPGLGGDDVITGTAANEVLLGGAGNDTLIGGAGNDHLIGGQGDDIYHFSSGQDVVDNTGGGTDKVHFVNGITFNQVASGLSKMGDDLILKVNGGPDQITLKKFFLGGEHLIDSFTFATGGQITAARIFAAFGLAIPTPSESNPNEVDGTTGDDASLTGTTEVDHIRGFNGDDQLSGDGGDDLLEGGNGHDILNGQAGNDTLKGGRGNDTYVFTAGDGQDVIDNADGGNDTLLFEGISFNQVASGLSRFGSDLILNIQGGTDTVTLKDWFLGGDNVVDTIRFASGGQITADQIFGAFGGTNPDTNGSPDYQNVPDERGYATILNGQAGDQIILGSSDAEMLGGGAGDDHLHGNGGNDYLMGGDGNDTYHFTTGGGADTINNLSNSAVDQDVLQLLGIEEENLWFTRSGDHLLIDVIGSDDQITVQDWYSNDAQKLDKIRTGDAVLLANKVENLVNAMAGFDAPPAGEAQLPQNVRDQVTPVITANWQTTVS